MAMTEATGAVDEAKWLRWRGVADLYHAYFTGLILTVVTRRGTADAAEFMFRVFRRQQQERFLPGLEKLGLSHLPPAVAAAQYHYLSNWIGGVSVEYMYETDRKAWIRRRRAGSGRARRSAACPAKCRARCCEAGTPTTAFRWAIQSSASSAPSRASTDRTDWKVITANMITRSNSTRGWYSRGTSKPPCSIPRPRRHCRLRAGQNRGSKKPIGITRWNMCGPQHP